jgi:hypothetical protein
MHDVGTALQFPVIKLMRSAWVSAGAGYTPELFLDLFPGRGRTGATGAAGYARCKEPAMFGGIRD